MVQKLLIAGVAILLLSMIVVVSMISKESIEPMVNQSDLRRDHLRIDHLKMVATRIQAYWDKNHELPPTLGNLIDRADFKKLPTDPRHSTDYEYHVTADQLCAIFSIETPRRKDDISKPGFWFHQKDHYCFDFVVAQNLAPTPNELLEEK